MSTPAKPAVALAATPGRRMWAIEMTQALERRGFPGVYCASFGDAMGLCTAMALRTQRITFGTAIVPIYLRHPSEYALNAAFLHEISGGRFRFGIGISHAPVQRRLGIEAGRPLADMKRFVEEIRAVPRIGDLPPVVVAGLRKRMVAFAGTQQGVVFANAARSHMAESLAALPPAAQANPDFFIGDMIPTCISDDEKAAAAVNRRTLSGYVMLPNYRNYWKEAGYVEEMEAIETALAAGQRERLPELMSDRWLADTTLYGTRDRVLEGLAAWYEAGVRTPILVPSSAAGNQQVAFQELLDTFA
jgi:alkanesulfonate monooxygenase SsuD/methylene tetrahydromethanopterin reductase-like flavin-dependent oxidoreductase (luciferase family)